MDPIRVHTLRLRRPLPPLPMAAQPWVEDALRCASLPGRWHNRWVLVRRMRLHLGARADTSAVSRALSAQWQQLAASAQPAEQASAQATVVWFADEPAARLALLVRVLKGQPTEAWFWQQVMPGRGAAADWVQALLAQPWRQPVSAARAHAFSVEAERLLRWAQGGESAATTRLAWAPAGGAAPSSPHQTPRSGEGVAAAASSGPTLRASRSSGRQVSEHVLQAGPIGPPPKAASDLPAMPPAEPGLGPVAALAPGAQAHPPAPARKAAIDAAPTYPCVAISHSPSQPQSLLDTGAATVWGGFCFVLNLWRQQPPVDGATAVVWLRALAAWLGVPLRDGLMALLNSLDATEPRIDPLPLRQMREQALRLTRLPLRRLLAGPGIVRASTTHIDIHLPLRSARLAVRRAGLDLDPGWQPLLQRVVGFHYEGR